jgi:hypothetical protein
MVTGSSPFYMSMVKAVQFHQRKGRTTAFRGCHWHQLRDIHRKLDVMIEPINSAVPLKDGGDH